MPNGEDATIDTVPAAWAGIATFSLVVPECPNVTLDEPTTTRVTAPRFCPDRVTEFPPVVVP